MSNLANYDRQRIINENEMQEWIDRGKAELMTWFENVKATSILEPTSLVGRKLQEARASLSSNVEKENEELGICDDNDGFPHSEML